MRLPATIYQIISVCSTAFLIAAGCGGGDDGEIVDGEPPAFDVSGTVVDFQTGQPIAGAATVVIQGLVPPPQTSISGANFQLTEIPGASVFHMLAGSPPDYVDTFNEISVEDRELDSLTVEVASAAYLSSLATAFGVALDGARGTLIGRVVDEAGAPLAGVPAEDFELNGAIPQAGPFFLDAAKVPSPGLMATSSSGYFVIFNLPPDNLTVNAAAGSDFTMTMTVSPAAAGRITLADVKAVNGEIPLPEQVSFTRDIQPIFDRRLCTGCHAKNGQGRQDGGLTLKDEGNTLYRELTEELSLATNTPRVNRQVPEESLILTKPGPPAGDHPNLTFANTQDPDYLLLLVWIREGALQN